MKIAEEFYESFVNEILIFRLLSASPSLLRNEDIFSNLVDPLIYDKNEQTLLEHRRMCPRIFELTRQQQRHQQATPKCR